MIDYKLIWAQDICNELNNAGFSNPKIKGEKWSTDQFENNIELIKMYIVFSDTIFQHLNSKGLINRGNCPVTNYEVDAAYFYEYYGRKVYLSPEGKAEMKKWDEKEQTKLFGKDTPNKLLRDFQEKNVDDIKEKKNGKIMLFFVIILLVLIYFKYC